MVHARKFLPPSTMINSVITLGESTVEPSNKNRQIVPPRTGKVLNAMVNGKAVAQKQADTVFSYKNSFINKIHHFSLNKEHPSQDENYFGLNSLDQAVLVNNSNKIDVYFFNETNTPITISRNCVIGSINIPESHAEVVDINVMTIAADSGSEATWLNNIPSLNSHVLRMPIRRNMFTRSWMSPIVLVCR